MCIRDSFEDLSKLPNLTRGLVARGYDDESIAKILGENWLRVLKKGGVKITA